MYSRGFHGVTSYLEVSTGHSEDRIRQLCARALAAPEAEWEPILSELKALIHEHVDRARDLASAAAAVALLKRNEAA
jgi:hypothetical protein